MGSTRLPGKVLLDVCGAPMLARDMARLARTPGVDALVVATTTLARDDAIAALCARSGWACFRGDEADVLDRYYRAATEHRADAVVRVTSDCPLIDPQVSGAVVRCLRDDPSLEYASNVHPRRTYPRGLDTEAIRMDVLARLWKEDRDPASREHVTAYVRRNPAKFRMANVEEADDQSAHRWTVDTPEDLELVRRIYAHFGRDDFGWREVLALLARHPDWVALNAHVVQKNFVKP
jgi:spore coat polysaccharide biosynthesis protein SpsF